MPGPPTATCPEAALYPDYASTRNERLWAVWQPGPGVLAYPTARDAIVPIEGVDLPIPLPEYTPSLQRTGTAGRRDLIRRKDVPSEWSIPLYLDTPAKAGDEPAWTVLLGGLMGRVAKAGTFATLTTALTGTNNDLTYTARAGGPAGNSVTIAYVVAGLNTALSVTVAGSAITVNVATDGAGAATSTANQVRTAVLASAAAMAVVSNVTLAEAAGTGVVTALAATALTGGSGTPSVTYGLCAVTTDLLYTVWHWRDNVMVGIGDCLSNAAEFVLSGEDEGKATFEGFGASLVQAGVSTLGAALADGAGTTLTFAPGTSERFVAYSAQRGVYLQIESEVVLLTAVDYVAETGTIVRGQQGTTGAAHAAGVTVGAWRPGPDPDPQGLIVPVMLGGVDAGSLTNLRVITCTARIDQHLEPRLDEYGQASATGYRPTELREVTVEAEAYARQEAAAFSGKILRGREEAWAIRGGAPGPPEPAGRVTLNFPRVKLREVTDEGGAEEFTRTVAADALETVGNDELTIVFD
jgi:hypothetical protein